MRKGLPKKYAKMGFKKGWKLYKASKRSTKRTQTKTSSRRGARNMAKKKKTYRRSGGFTMSAAIKVVTGASLAAVYEVVVSPMIPVGGMIKNVIELMVGLMLAASKGLPKSVRAFGAALATINAYSMVAPLVQGYWGGKGAATADEW